MSSCGGRVPEIREMTQEEIPETSALLQRCYTWLAEQERLSAEQTEFLCCERGSEETVRRESSTQTYLTAREDGKIVGLAALSGNTVTKLYVLPSAHHRGFGRALYEAAESRIRSAGHTKVTLGSFPSAVKFHEAMGFRPVGLRQARGALTGLTITLMEKRLVGPEPSESS
jgi:GNAT superfamily N-acetyltransferase